MTFPEYSVLGLGAFSSYLDAALALEQLQHEGFSKNQLSFIVRLSDRDDDLTAPLLGHGYVRSMPSASNPIENNGLTRLMNSTSPVSTYSLPGVGQVMAGGELGVFFSDSSGGETQKPLLQFLNSLTIPELSARLYKDRIQQGDCLVIVGGSRNHLTAAENILSHYQIQDWQLVTVNHPGATQPSDQRQAIGIFKHYNDLERAIRELQHVAFPMEKVSLITRNHDDNILGDRLTQVEVLEDENLPQNELPDTHASEERPNYQVGQGAKTGTLAGGSLGGLAGLLVGLGTLALPGVGPILLAGTAATAVATTLAGGIMGATAGGLVGAMVGLGIPESRAQVYQQHLAQDHYVVMILGTETEIMQSEQILKSHGVEEWEVYELSTQTNSPTYENGLDNSLNTSPTVPPVHNPIKPSAFPY